MDNKANIPDFDVMMKLVDIIASSKVELASRQLELDTLLAVITKEVTEDRSYWVGNKPPTSTFIKSTYHVLGRNEEERERIVSLRYACAELEARVSSAEHKFRTYRNMIDVWRTESANSRNAGY